MGDIIEVIDWLDSDSTTGFNIFGIYWLRNKEKEKNTKQTEGICLIES